MNIRRGDCRLELPKLESASVDFVCTDPPYFIDGMGDEWDADRLHNKASKAGVVGGLPVGMKFDREQGKRLYDFLLPVCQELFRVLKPGAYCCVFSQARLYHRTAMALEDSGFEVRDMLGWCYTGQAKAFSQSHFVKRRKDLSEAERERIIKELDGWKTPQMTPCIEPIVLAQKPKEGTFVDNWLKWGVGLMNANERLDGAFPKNLIYVDKSERRNDCDFKVEHLTPKPVKLISHLIRLFTRENQVVLDPFMGSGSHGQAALQSGSDFIGFELDEGYYELCKRRLHCVS